MYAVQFQRDGFGVLQDFVSESEIQEMKVQCADLVDKMDFRNHRSVFSTTSPAVTEYFN